MAHEQRTRALAVLAGLGALLVTAPPPATAVAVLREAASSTDPTGPLVAAVALLAWAAAGWLALTVTVVLLSRVPGLLGRTARALSGRVAPATVRRAVEAALGLTVAVGVLAPTAALAAPVGGPGVVVSGTDAAWDLDWPSRRATAPAPSVAPAGAPATTGGAPVAATPRTTARSAPPTSTSPAPARPPAAPPATTAPAEAGPPSAPAAAPPAAVRPRPAPRAAPAVVVRPGDSLWSLAEAALRRTGTTAPTDRQVAQAWPRWWAANRGVIGDDPDLLLPGTVLLPPADQPGRS